MDLGITGRVAIVTRASAGIGFAVGKELLANGTSVFIVARDPDRLQGARAALLELPAAKVAAMAVDVTALDAAILVIAQAVATFGLVEILVNNAGRAHAGGLMSLSEADWEEMTAVRLTSMRRFCKSPSSKSGFS